MASPFLRSIRASTSPKPSICWATIPSTTSSSSWPTSKRHRPPKTESHAKTQRQEEGSTDFTDYIARQSRNQRLSTTAESCRTAKTPGLSSTDLTNHEIGERHEKKGHGSEGHKWSEILCIQSVF